MVINYVANLQLLIFNFIPSINKQVNNTVYCLFSIVGVTITTIGSPTVGNSYTLKCSVSGTSDPASYQWFGPPNGQSITNSSSRMVFSNSSLTLLEFSPLQASHTGVYTCRATVRPDMGNSVNVTASKSVIVQSEHKKTLNDTVLFIIRLMSS